MTSTPALIFDFDGLLVDTESSALLAWREQFAVHELAFPLEVWHQFIGSQGSQQAMVAEIRRGGVEFVDVDLLGEWRERHNRIVSSEQLRPGVEAFLDDASAAGAKFAVASSATRDWLDQQLGRLGVHDRFEVICARDNGRVKPAPDIYLAALAALGVEASGAIAFEDSPNGITAAKAAEIYCVAVPNAVTAGLPLEQADLRVESFTELSFAEVAERLRTRPATK
jgi:HAD superfamily hydrolase (TIGR01509 family)